MLNLDGLYEHQKAGVRWLLENPRGMLAWEMGVGKTATASRAWELTQEQGPLLVLCLASARENWRREIQRFTVDPAWPPSVHIIDRTDALGEPPPNVSAVVTNYDKVQNKSVAGWLRSRRWGAIILDEAHLLKTPSAARTRFVYGGGRKYAEPLIARAARVWPLTGTPMPNNPAELWAHAFHLWPEALLYNGEPMDLATFELGFCVIQEGEHGKSVIGGRNLEELKKRLSPYMNRLRRERVLSLPPLRIDAWPLDISETSSTTIPDAPELLEKLSHYGRIETFDQTALDAFLACINAEWLPLSTMRRETGILKAIAVLRLLSDELCLTCDQKVVVFAHHREAIDSLAKGLARFQPAILHGGVPSSKRQAEIDRFQDDPNCRVFVGQLQAAGASINLQAANQVIFAEASWSPGENDQALSRVYRAGQTKPVLVRFTYLKGSIDEAVNRALSRKAAMIAQVVD